EEVDVALELVRQERGLLVDQELGAAVVSHGDGQVHPGAAGDEVGAEDDAAVRPAVGTGGAVDLGQHHAGGVAVAVGEADGVAEDVRAAAVDELQAAAGFEQAGKFRDEAGTVAGVRV